MKTFQDLNIEVPSGSSGEIRTICPTCSPNRKKTTERCLAVNVDEGTYFCHHCGYSGGLKSGEGKVYTRPKYVAKTDLPANVTAWFGERGISEQTLLDNKIGYGQHWMPQEQAEVGTIQFPYIKGGQVVNIKFRDGKKGFCQAKDAEKCLYRFDEIAKVEGDTLLISEGEIDCLSLVEAGFKMSASIPDGAPSANAKQYVTKFDFLNSAYEIIAQYEKVILAVDNDEPGKRAEVELARRIGVEKCYRVKYPEGCKDSNDVLVKYGWEALRKTINAATPYPVEGIVAAMDVAGQLESMYDNGVQRGDSCGFASVDPYYTVKPCQMSIVTGIPGSGKSGVIDQFLINMANEYGNAYAMYSPENWPVERHLQTLIEKIMMQPFFKSDYSGERMDRDDMQFGIKHINKHFHFIMPPEDAPNTIDAILEKTKILIRRYGISGLVIDPWNEVDHEFGNVTETQYISQQLTKIRRFARMNGIHIWVIAHPKNLKKGDDGKYPPPTMYDISGGAHWRNKADNGICVHRKNPKTTEVMVIIQKIRFRDVGKTGEAAIQFIRETGGYSE